MSPTGDKYQVRRGAVLTQAGRVESEIDIKYLEESKIDTLDISISISIRFLSNRRCDIDSELLGIIKRAARIPVRKLPTP